jgi:hypothetical protein
MELCDWIFAREKRMSMYTIEDDRMSFDDIYSAYSPDRDREEKYARYMEEMNNNDLDDDVVPMPGTIPPPYMGKTGPGSDGNENGSIRRNGAVPVEGGMEQRNMGDDGREMTRTVRDPPRRKNRKWKIFTLVSIVLGLVALGTTLALLFCRERNVSFELLPLAIDNSTINVTPDGFSLPLNPGVRSRNDNYFDIVLTDVLVRGTHPLYAQGTVPMGTGSVSGVVLESRDETQFNFPFFVSFNRTYDPELLYFERLLTNCSATPDIARLYFDVSIDVNFKMWAKSGSINRQMEILVPCPISQAQAINLKTNVLGGGIHPQTPL